MLYSGGTLTEASPSDYGDRNPLISSAAVFSGEDGIQILERNATYSAIYKSQQWIGTLVDKLAGAQARLPFKTYQPGETGRISTADQAFGRLMRRPCPGHGRHFFWLWTASTFEVNGESMWVKIRNPATRLPVALWPLHPANVDVRKRPKGQGGGVEYVWKTRAADGSEIKWGPDEIVHFKAYNPDTIYRGLSRLESLRASLLAEAAVQAAQASFWHGGARPSVLLQTKGKLSDPARDRLRAQWENLHGGVRKWGKTAVLEEGVEAKIVQLSAQEMQMIEQRKISREEACARYDVPPPVVHILDRATFSNVTEQMRSMYRDTMGGRLGIYESAVDEQLAAEFSDRDYAKFLLDEVLRGDFEKRMTAYAQGIHYGIYKPNEVRTKEDLEVVGPEGDQLFVQSSLVPMSQADQPRQPAGSTPSARGLRSALGRLSRLAGLEEVDLGVVTRGLDEVTAETVAVHLSHAIVRDDDLGGLRAALAAEERTASEHEQQEEVA